jgi:hypothetical protein
MGVCLAACPAACLVAFAGLGQPVISEPATPIANSTNNVTAPAMSQHARTSPTVRGLSLWRIGGTTDRRRREQPSLRE